MSVLDSIKIRAKELKKSIILSESEDERVIDAAILATKEGIANIILIANKERIYDKYKDKDLTGITFIDPDTYDKTSEFINEFYEMRKSKGVTIDDATKLIKENYIYFACMMLYFNLADGVVSGACHSSSDTLRPALQILKTKDTSDLVSAFFLMDVPASVYGENGVFLFSDAGLNQNPTSEELASIANDTRVSFELLVGKTAKVAFLSHSTKGSSKHEDVLKVSESVEIARSKYPDMLCDGELQLDAAIVPEVALIKAPNSPVAGYANTLIFPDLDAGNIGYKLVERLAHAHAYGPITQGIGKPFNDLSRGCSASDIVGVIAITALQSENDK